MARHSHGIAASATATLVAQPRHGSAAAARPASPAAQRSLTGRWFCPPAGATCPQRPPGRQPLRPSPRLPCPARGGPGAPAPPRRRGPGPPPPSPGPPHLPAPAGPGRALLPAPAPSSCPAAPASPRRRALYAAPAPGPGSGLPVRQAGPAARRRAPASRRALKNPRASTGPHPTVPQYGCVSGGVRPAGRASGNQRRRQLPRESSEEEEEVVCLQETYHRIVESVRLKKTL